MLLGANVYARPQYSDELRKFIVGFSESLQTYWKADAFVWSLEYDEGCSLAGTEPIDQVVVHNYLRDAAAQQATDKSYLADIGLINFQVEPGRKQNAHRCDPRSSRL